MYTKKSTSCSLRYLKFYILLWALRRNFQHITHQTQTNVNPFPLPTIQASPAHHAHLLPSPPKPSPSPSSDVWFVKCCDGCWGWPGAPSQGLAGQCAPYSVGKNIIWYRHDRKEIKRNEGNGLAIYPIYIYFKGVYIHVYSFISLPLHL